MTQPRIVFRASHEPTPAQIKAGNYKKKQVVFAGFPVSIENKAGEVRRGVDRDGHAWETRMLYDYGYIKGTLGTDKDHVDCFLGSNESAPFVYLITTMKAGQWDKPDEQKAMIGFDSEEDARVVFLAHYDDPRYLGEIAVFDIEDFRDKLKGTRENPVLIKGGAGSGWHAPPKGTHGGEPEITGLASAKAYWDEHYAGKTMRFGVHTKSRGIIEIEVMFPANNDHAYTEDEGRASDGRKNGKRVFDPDRARLMHKIPSTIEHPAAILMDRDKNLHIERSSGGKHHIVVLAFHAGTGQYRFSSSHDRPTDEVNKLKMSLRPTLPQGKEKTRKLMKSIRVDSGGKAPSAFQVFDHSSTSKFSNGWSGAVSSDPLGIHSGSGHRQLCTLSEVMFMYKACCDIGEIGVDRCCYSDNEQYFLIWGENAEELEKSLVTKRVEVKGTIRKDGSVIKPHTRLQKVRIDEAGDDDDGKGDDLDHKSENYRYRDTGYVPGSRKEMAASMIRRAGRDGRRLRLRDIPWLELEANPREAEQVITKTNLFGKVDWEALRESGMEAGAAFLIAKLYATIGVSPTGNTAKDRESYALALETLRDRMEKCRAVSEVTDTIDEIQAEAAGTMMTEEQQARYAVLYEAFREKAKKHRETLDRINELQAARNGVRTWQVERDIENRKRNKWKIPQDLLDKLASLKREKAEKEKAWEDALHDPAVKLLDNEYNELASAVNEFEKKCRRENAANPISEAWRQLGDGFIGAVRYRYSKGSGAFRKHVASVTGGEVKDWSWLDKKTEPRKITKQSADFQLIVADKFEREGGREISVDSTASLKQHFHLRDVQSGNWVLKDVNSAKFHVERCAEAFADLADMLDIPDRQISFNSRLAMAFGARGSGGKNSARAHYEYVQRIINITKMAGGGTLAHEWFHSVDNLLSEAEGRKTNTSDHFTEQLSEIKNPKIKEAALGLINALKAGNERATKTLEYSEDDERWAMKNMEQSIAGPIREGVRLAKDAQEAVDHIEYFYRKGHFGKPKSRRALESHDYWIKVALIYHGNNESRKMTYRTGEGLSKYMMEAKKLDQGRNGKPYWSTLPEMAARAFESYIDDKLASAKRKNTYLVNEANNKPYEGYELKPYPEGDEREKINRAFDALFAAFRDDDTLTKALLKGGEGSGWFSPPNGDHGSSSLPSSEHIANEEQAKEYWDTHYGGKTMNLTVHSGKNADGGKRAIPIRVHFDEKNDHAYTEDEGGRQKTGYRMFDKKRAQAMSRILSVIEYPKLRLRNFTADLLLERNIGGNHYTIVLTWRDEKGLYDFRSAHFKEAREVQYMLQHNERRNNEGPLQKSDPSQTDFADLQDAQHRDFSHRWLPIFRSGNGLPIEIMPSFDELCKAFPALEGAETVFLFHCDDPFALKLLKATPAGAKWITVHPNGGAGKGVPVLIQETKKGSGVWHVIGGAGGKLNYLKIHELGEGKNYKQDLAERQAARRKAKAEQQRRDKETGVYEEKQAVRKNVTEQKKSHEQEYIEAVAEAMGWDEETTRFDEDKYSDLSEKAIDKLRSRHHTELLKRAHEAVNLQRMNLAANADAQAKTIVAPQIKAMKVSPKHDVPPSRHNISRQTVFYSGKIA
ncbi:MAG: hypothetical protein LBS40_05480 [Burkholderiales bacterium]|jgi:hypothetical protein|nr:hypothetical protein [Burkholderiales bacterium]